MKTKFFKTACKALGAGHFVAQTTADLLVNAEASLASKHLGMDKNMVIINRIKATDSYQLSMRNRLSKLSKSSKSKTLKTI